MPFPLVPLTELPSAQRWIQDAALTGVHTDDPLFREVMTDLCVAYSRELMLSRERQYQAEFNAVCEGMLGDRDNPRSGEGPLWRLKARMLRGLEQDVREGVNAWTRAVQAAAGRTGVLEALNESRLKQASALLHRRLLRASFQSALPTPLPNLVCEDLEDQLRELCADGKVPFPHSDALNEYRIASALELSKLVRAATKYQASKELGPDIDRGPIADAMVQLLEFELNSSRKLAAAMPAPWGDVFVCAVHAKLLGPAKDMLKAKAGIALIRFETRESSSAVVEGVWAELGRAERSMVAISTRSWRRMIEDRQRGEGAAGEPFVDQMRAERHTLGTAVASQMNAFAGALPAGSAELLARLREALGVLGDFDSSGAWKPSPIDANWPGSIARSSG